MLSLDEITAKIKEKTYLRDNFTPFELYIKKSEQIKNATIL